MKFIALVEYEYPVLHKPPVKAELVLHGDRVETEEIKVIGVDRIKMGRWNFMGDQMFRCTKCEIEYTQKQFEYMRIKVSDAEFPQYCPHCGAFMVNGGDAE